MSTNQQLQISPKDQGAALTKDEKRFNRLIERIAIARALLLAWQDAIPLFHQAYVTRIAPLHAALAAARREWVLALERALQRKDWSRPDRKTLQLCGQAQQQGVFAKSAGSHSSVVLPKSSSFSAGKRFARGGGTA